MRLVCSVAALCLAITCVLSQEGCQEKGFTGAQTCSDCEKLVEYTGSEELGADCRECCKQEESGARSSTVFNKAILEVCQHRLRDFPHIEGFIKNAAARYPALTVSYKYASFPKLILKTGKQKEAIRIDHWKGDNIEEYLRDRLEASA